MVMEYKSKHKIKYVILTFHKHLLRNCTFARCNLKPKINIISFVKYFRLSTGDAERERRWRDIKRLYGQVHAHLCVDRMLIHIHIMYIQNPLMNTPLILLKTKVWKLSRHMHKVMSVRKRQWFGVYSESEFMCAVWTFGASDDESK